MKLIDGKDIAKTIKLEIATKVAKIIDAGKRAPHLAAILVGNDGASATYVASKEKACREVGITSSVYKYPQTMKESELIDVVNFLNNDDEVDGFIIQLPLPKHINADVIIEKIYPKKDVDGFNPYNIGNMTLGKEAHLPATPAGIVQLLEKSNIETEGKHVVVVGRSNIVGTPISILLSRKAKNANATVTLCHSYTKNIEEYTQKADILIVAIGIPNFITGNMIKNDAIVIDVGIHRVKDESEKGYKIIGDVNFEEVATKCSFITPVPGGVGPMTIACLLQNTINAYMKQ